MTARGHVVIAAYRPTQSLSCLTRELSSMWSVTVADDASPCTFDGVFREVDAIDNVTVIRHEASRGIARSLNDGLSAAVRENAQWLLTVDQDSSIDAHYCEVVARFLDEHTSGSRLIGAAGAEVVADASGDMRYPLRETEGLLTTEELVQSGTVWSVAALQEIGGFDESLGIDAVDAAACLRLRQRGYAVAVIPGLRMQHTIGNARMVRVLGRSIMVTGHSPERRSSMVRNRLKLFPDEFRQSPRHALRTIRRVGVNHTLGLVIEPDRWKKVKGTIRGLRASGDR